ncbi:MAG: cation:proton antiporter [Azospirillaceae bacterium]
MPEIGLLLLVVALLLVVVALLQPAAARLGVPHSVLLAVVGIAIGAGAAALDTHGADALSEFVGAIDGLDLTATAILYVFLPVLLFQTGLTIDVRRMVDDIAPILVLAILAVFVCTFAVGLALSPVAPVGLTACLLLGAIIATTDPVAVVGIFREVGAPRRLSILVEGESLFNDAAAIALFALLLGVLTGGEALSVGQGAWQFTKGFLGGLLAGWAAARLAGLFLRPLRDQPLAETSVSVALAYAVFIVAERYLGVSGVVAVVTAALVFGASGRMRVTPQSWTALNDVWAQLGFWASTLIFVLASMLVPRFLAQVGWSDLGLLAVLVVAAFAARAAVLWGVLPALSAAGLAQRVDDPLKAVILWGGLRGAVTLALALAVTENPVLDPEVKRFVGVLATGFVLFTLLVNALTLRPVMRALGLDGLAPVDRALRDRAIALALGEVADRIAELGGAHRLDPDMVDQEIAEYRRRRDRIVTDSDRRDRLGEDDQIGTGLIALADREEALYLHHFAQGTMARRLVITLVAKAGRLRDAAKTRGREGYQAAAADSLQFRVAFRGANLVHRWLRLEGPLAARLADRFESLAISRMVIWELIAFNNRTLTPLLGPGVTHGLRAALDRRLESCEQALEALRLQYPDYERALQHRFVKRAALRMEGEAYRELYAHSAIPHEVHTDLQHRLAEGWAAVDSRPHLDLELDTATLVRGFSMFEQLDEAALSEIGQLLRPRLVLPEERIVTRGERGDSMYFIASGAVEVGGGGSSFRLGRGDFFGELAVLTGRRRNADVTAIAYCRLLELSGRDFRRFVKAHPEARGRIREVARERLAATEGRPVARRALPGDEAAE